MKKLRTKVVERIFLLTTRTDLSYKDGEKCTVKIVFSLATKKKNHYYELFTRDKIENEEDTLLYGGCYCKNFDTPYIVKVEPLSNHLNFQRADLNELEKFINNYNRYNSYVY